jgi:hypothetical protein
LAACLHLNRGILRVYAVASTAVWSADPARHGENCGVLALVELGFLGCVAATAEGRDFLRSRDSVRRRSAGGFAVLRACAVTRVAAQRFRGVRVLEEITDLFGVAGLAQRVHGLGVKSERQDD